LFEAFAGPEASIVNIFGLLRVDWRAARERTQDCLDALCSYGDREAAAFDGRPGLTAAAARLTTGWRRQRASCALTSPRALLGTVGAERDLSTVFRQPQLLAEIDGLLETGRIATAGDALLFGLVEG